MANICTTCHVKLTKENSLYGWGRCTEHWKCDDCDTAEKLCQRTEGLLCDPCHAKRMERRIKNFKGHTDYEIEATCPWCGHKESDSYEMSDGQQECPDCNKLYPLTRETTITYTTKKIRVLKEATPK